MPEQFFVIGGRYRDLDFVELIEGTAHVLGPYTSYDEAQRVWKERSADSRSDAKARYTIVRNASDPRRMLQAA